MEHKLGGMLREEEKAQGERTDLTSSHRETKLDAFESVGIKKAQAYRYEVMSHYQTKVMERNFAECRAKRK